MPLLNRISQEKKVHFFHNLSTLLKSRIPLTRALESLIQQERNPKFLSLLKRINEKIHLGYTLSECLTEHTKIFTPIQVNIVRAGEAAGNLPMVIKQLAEYETKKHKTLKKIMSAMTYPVTVLIFAFALLSILTVFVIPKFQTIYADILKDAPLPLLTQIILNSSSYIRESFLILIAFSLIKMILTHAILKHETLRKYQDYFLLKLPSIGGIIQSVNTFFFSKTLSILVSSGVPFLQALDLSSQSTSNMHMQKGLQATLKKVEEGASFAESIEAQRIFSPLVNNMIAVGEESGSLTEMLEQIATETSQEAENSINALTSLVEPAMILALALIIGITVIGMFLPLIGLMDGLAV